MASKEDVRGIAKLAAEGKKPDQDQQRALDRTTRQAGPEQRAVKRILGGGKA